MRIILTAAEHAEILSALAQHAAVWSDGFVGFPDADRKTKRRAATEAVESLAARLLGSERVVVGSRYDNDGKWFPHDSLTWLLTKAKVEG